MIGLGRDGVFEVEGQDAVVVELEVVKAPGSEDAGLTLLNPAHA